MNGILFKRFTPQAASTTNQEVVTLRREMEEVQRASAQRVNELLGQNASLKEELETMVGDVHRRVSQQEQKKALPPQDTRSIIQQAAQQSSQILQNEVATLKEEAKREFDSKVAALQIQQQEMVDSVSQHASRMIADKVSSLWHEQRSQIETHSAATASEVSQLRQQLHRSQEESQRALAELHTENSNIAAALHEARVETLMLKKEKSSPRRGATDDIISQEQQRQKVH